MFLSTGRGCCFCAGHFLPACLPVWRSLPLSLCVYVFLCVGVRPCVPVCVCVCVCVYKYVNNIQHLMSGCLSGVCAHGNEWCAAVCPSVCPSVCVSGVGSFATHFCRSQPASRAVHPRHSHCGVLSRHARKRAREYPSHTPRCDDPALPSLLAAGGGGGGGTVRLAVLCHASLHPPVQSFRNCFVGDVTHPVNGWIDVA